MEKVSFFRVENNFTLWMNMICSHSQVECVCLCSKKVMKENCLLRYRVDLKVSQTYNHNKNLFLIVCYCSVCLHWRVCKSFWVAHLHSAARALLSPNLNKFWQRFLSLSFVLRCCDNFLYRRKAANLISCVSFFNIVKFYTPKIIITRIKPTKSESLLKLIKGGET